MTVDGGQPSLSKLIAEGFRPGAHKSVCTTCFGSPYGLPPKSFGQNSCHLPPHSRRRGLGGVVINTLYPSG
jgi:hypothetical protein